MTIIVQVDRETRYLVYPEGGFQKEIFITGPGWILDTEEEVLIEDIKVLREAKTIVDNSLSRL